LDSHTYTAGAKLGSFFVKTNSQRLILPQGKQYWPEYATWLEGSPDE